MKKYHFITYQDGTEPYFSMAEELTESCLKHHPRSVVYDTLMLGPGEGREFFAEVLGRSWRFFSDHLTDGPVVLLDADCLLVDEIVLPADGWDIAAVHRGHCSNSYGCQDFLSTVVAFNNERPDVSRRFWALWLYDMLSIDMSGMELPRSVAMHNDRLKEQGWKESWFADQASLNRILRARMVRYDVGRVESLFDRTGTGFTRILPLDRDVYAAKHGTEGAKIVHYKGDLKCTNVLEVLP